MPNWKTLALIIFLVFCLAGTILFKQYFLANTQSPSATPLSMASPSPSASQKCSYEDLDARVEFDGAAGSINGTFAIKNSSGHTCVLAGKSQLDLIYDPQITSISIDTDQPSSDKEYTLADGESISATARIQNGPQCSTSILPVNVTYAFDLPGDQNIIFKDSGEIQNFTINACALPTDKTNVTLTSFAPVKE